MSEWQPIETAPKDGRTVLLLIDGKSVAYGHFLQLGWYWSKFDESDDGHDGEATHWMPLPALPGLTVKKGEKWPQG